MHYYIDGYNLLFRLYGNKNDFTKQRQHLIDELNQKAELLNLSITVVFDSQYQDSESTRSHYKNIIIVFTKKNETADERILDEIKSEEKPHLQTVVTSDKKLAWFARRCSAKTESTEQFTEWLYKRNQNRLRQNKTNHQKSKKTPQQSLKKISGTKPFSILTKSMAVQEEPKKPEEPRAPEPPKVIKPPEASKSVEACSNYYLETFQKKFDDQSVASSKKSEEVKKVTRRTIKALKQSKKPPRHDKEKPLSDTARWLKIFSTEKTDEIE